MNSHSSNIHTHSPEHPFNKKNFGIVGMWMRRSSLARQHAQQVKESKRPDPWDEFSMRRLATTRDSVSAARCRLVRFPPDFPLFPPEFPATSGARGPLPPARARRGSRVPENWSIKPPVLPRSQVHDSFIFKGNGKKSFLEHFTTPRHLTGSIEDTILLIYYSNWSLIACFQIKRNYILSDI